MAENNEATPEQQKSIGVALREAREARNLSLEQVSRATRIHADVLRALEADDTSKLGAVYTKSFLRLYADFLGLDREGLVARFLAAIPSAAVVGVRKAAAPEAASQRSVVRFTGEVGRRFWFRVWSLGRRVPWQRVAAVLLAALLLFGTVRWIKGCRVRRREQRAHAVSLAVPAAKETPPPVAAVTKMKDEQKVVLVVRAVEKTWLQVKVDDKIIFQSVLAKGSSESWKAREKIELWIGDAGALELEVNGRFLDRIGRRGQTLKEVVITTKGLVVRS